MSPEHFSETRQDGYALSDVLMPFPFVCFTLTFLSDIVYWQTADLQWQNFSAWLLFAGLFFGVTALILSFIDILRPSTRWRRALWPAALVYVCVLVLALVNSLVHAGDGWTAVVPTGLILSAITVFAILIALTISARLTRKSRRRA